MLKKALSSVICGAYISLGATVFLLIDNPIVGAFFFTSGICLVTCYCNMLATRVFPLFALKEYGISDIFISFAGNTAGAAVYSLLLSNTRLGPLISERLNSITGMKLNDTYISIFIMAVFCGFMVAAGCLAYKVFSDNKGVAVFMCVLFVTVFVICGFEHVVANAFYFSFYMINTDANPMLIITLLVSLLGNAAGGIGCGLMYRHFKV